MGVVLSFLNGLMRRQFWFAAVVCTLLATMLIWNEGLSLATGLATFGLALVLGLWALLVWFWGAVFKSLMTGPR